MKKTERKRKSVSLLLVAIMLCSIFTGAVSADVNEDATANTDLVLSNPSSNTGNTGYEPWYYYADGIVNTANGNLYFSEEDISIKARGFDIEIIRSYNSHNSGKYGPFGFGWTFNYNIYLVEKPDNSVTFFDGDGSAHTFTPAGGNEYNAPPGIHLKLTKNPDGSFVLWFTDGLKYNFGSNGKLINIIDKNDNHLNFTYNILGRVTRISNDSGLYLDLNYNTHGRISSVVDPIGRQIKYEYEVANLVKVTDAMGNSSLYQYYDDHKLKSKVDRVNSMFISSYHDDGKVKDVKVSKYGEKDVTPFTLYKLEYASNIAYVTGALGHTTKIEHNSGDSPIKITNPLGGVTTMHWDSDMNLISFTDTHGHTTSYEYDDYGNLIKETDALGNSIPYGHNNIDTSAKYISLLANITNSRGFTTSFEYDAKGNLIRLTDATGNHSYGSYDAFGNLISTTDFRGYTTQISYDTHGNRFEITDPTGNVTMYGYDVVGRLVNVTDADGYTIFYEYDANDNRIKLIDNIKNETTYEYDAEGALIRTIYADGSDRKYGDNNLIDPLGDKISFEVDKNGNLIKITNSRGYNTSRTYDALNRLISITDALGNTESYSYDAVGNLISTTDKIGNTVSYIYDRLNRIIKITDVFGHTVNYTYDAAGKTISETDENGHIIIYEYDALDRLIKITNALGNEISYTYDEDGNILRYTDANEHSTIYAYDTLNRITKIISPLGYQTQYAYDAVWQLISRTDANGYTANYEYDAGGRLTSINYPDGSKSKIERTYDAVGSLIKVEKNIGTDLDYLKQYTYNKNSQLISTSINYGSFSKRVNYTYDGNGNRVSMIYPDGGITKYEYDALDRLISITDPSGETTTYQYDRAGRRIGIKYPNGVTTGYTYDAKGRLLSLINKKSNGDVISSYTYTYDKVRNRLSMTEANADVTKYEYDKSYRLIKITNPSGNTTQYTYDAADNRLLLSKGNNTIYYTYDVDGRLLTANGINYSYDDNGNLISRTDANGTTHYEYNYENRLNKVIHPDTSQNLYQYSSTGDRLSKIDVNGTIYYLYDFEDILMELDENGLQNARYTHGYMIDEPIIMNRGGDKLYYHSDGLGSITSLTDVNENIISTYNYDAFGEIIKKPGNVNNSFTYTGREYDDEIGLYYYRARYYDPEIGRFISKDPIMRKDPLKGRFEIPYGKSLEYTYAGNNPVNYKDPWGLQPFGEWPHSEVGYAIEIIKAQQAATAYKKPPTKQERAELKRGEKNHFFSVWICRPLPSHNVGHAFLSITDSSGKTDFYGWYPRESKLYGTGELLGFGGGRVETTHQEQYHDIHYPKHYPITKAQADKIRTFANTWKGQSAEGYIGFGREIWSLGNNCVDFVIQAGRSAGIDLPSGGSLWYTPETFFEEMISKYGGKKNEYTKAKKPLQHLPQVRNDHPDDNYDVSILSYPSSSANKFNYKPEEVAILANGFYEEFSNLLAELGESTTFVDVDTPLEDLNEYPILIIPSGGFFGLDTLSSFKSKLEQYVSNGGTLIVFSQQHGYEFDAVPGDLCGYGWAEDQSCQHRSVGISTYQPILSGQDSVTLDVVVDGYFTTYQENATILLSRTKNGMPAFLMYEYGNGTVIATTIFTDWAYGHHQATRDGKTLIKNMISWAKERKELPEYGAGDSINIPINVTSYIDLTANKVKFTVIDPDKKVVDTVNITTSILPYETKTVNFTDTAPSKLGIWHLDYSLVNDSYGEVQCMHDTQRFAVSKYAENPDGFVYQGKKITFTISSPEEQYAYGSDVPFTIHIWNKGDTARNISFSTYYKDWMLRTKLPEQNVEGTLNVSAGGDASFTHTLHVGDIYLSHNQLIIYASFSEDGTHLGRTEKVVYMFSPSVSVDVETDQKEYAKGEDVSVLLNLRNRRSASCNATIIVKTLDPDNRKIYENSFNINLSAFASGNKTLNFTLPIDSKYGIYIVTAEAYSNGNKIGSDSTYFKMSKNYIVRVKFDRPNKLYRIREDISMDLEVTNLGATPWNSTVNVSIPAIGFNDSRDFTLNPNETEKVNYNLNIPETTPAGKHDVIVTISYDNSTKEDCFFIPESDLILSSDKSSYNAGENLSINVSNIGGVDTTFNCSVKFSDRKSFVIYENDTQGNISVGENKTISFEIPDQAVNGIYHLIASCKDLKTNKTTLLSKSYEISGLKVFLITSTNKRIYFKNETIRALTNITNLDGSIENATLNLRVYSGMYRAAPEVTTTSLDGRLEINNTFIDAVVNSGSDFDSSGPTALGQNTQTRYKHKTKIESTEQRNRNSIMPMAVFDGDIGRFTVGTTGGDPENPDDDYEELMYGHPYHPWSSFTTIRIDGKDYIYGTSEGNFISSPHFEDSSIVSDWEIEDVVVTQKLTIVYSSTGNPDALEIKYSIVNENETSKDVGVRVMIDTQLAENDGAPFVIPDVGDVTKEREFIGADVPLWWTTMDSLTDPSIIAHGTLRGVGSDPDKFVIADWWYLEETLWDYDVDPDEWITDDSAIGIWWNPISLSAEQSREVATFYGIGYVSEVGGVVVWEEEMPLSIAEEAEADISTNITLNTTGKFSLVSTLFSDTSQVIDQNKSYFYITEENTSLTLETDKLVYKPNEEITIFGEVTNYAVIANDYNLSIKVNEEEIFSDTFSLDPNQSHLFTTNTRQNNSFILEGTVNEVTITDFVRIEYPSVNAIILAPDVVGFADFDVNVLIENIGNIAADLVVNINSTWNITVPEGESRLLETTKNITENTTLNVIISGDVNKTIQKEIIFGENTKINITPADTYLEGTVEIPFVITNICLLDTEFNATFSISSDGQTISRRFFVPKGGNISDSVSFNITKGAHLLRYNSPFEEVIVRVNVLSPPEFVVTSILPADMNFTIGENVTLVFKVKNIGGSEGEATLRLLMPDFEDTNRTWVRAGAEENISFNLTISDDLEEKNYKGIYELDGKRDEFTFFVQGANISVDASLDKPLYEEGETAILTLNVNSERNIDLSLYSRVKFNEYDSVQNFTLPGSGSETLEFNVPVQFTGDNKMLYTVYMDSGRALYINSIYVYEKKPDVPLRLYTDKDVYNMGEDVTIHIVDVTETDVLNLTAPSYTYNDTVSGPTTLEFTLRELMSGTYYIDYTFGNFSSSLPFDVIGYFVRILEAGLDKEEYISGDNVKLRMNIETNRNVSGLLKTWIYDPEDELIDEFEMNRTLMEGENEIEISRILLTNISGIHVIVYGFYADLSGHSLTSLVSGAEYFDASPPLDTEPPIISNVRATGITSNSATITWDTDEVSNSLVKYGTESGNYAKQEYDATNVTSHTINLVGLNANTTYYYVVNSTDTSNNSNQSIEHSFTTLTPPNLPPVANANGPYTGIVGEPITFNGTGSYDPDGTIVSYEWDLDDDGEFGDAIGPTPSETWNIPYSGTISLKVTDDDGEVGTDTTIITVLAAYDIAYDLKEDAITDLKAINTTDKHAQKDIDKAIQHINKSLEGSLWNGTTRLDPKHGHKVFDEEKKAVKAIMHDLCKCKEITNLTLKYNGTVTVDIEVYDGSKRSKLIVSYTNVTPGGTIFIDGTTLPKGKLGAETTIKIYDNATGTRNLTDTQKIHTSCSRPLDVGMTFGDLEVTALNKIIKCPECCDVGTEVIDKLVKADKLLAETALNDAISTNVTDPKNQDKVNKEIAKAEEELTKAAEEVSKGKPDKAIDHYKKAWEHAQKAIEHAQKHPKPKK